MNKGQTVNSKKTVCMDVIKGGVARSELHIFDLQNKSCTKMELSLKGYKKYVFCGAEVRRRIDVANDIFKKLNKVLGKRNIS